MKRHNYRAYKGLLGAEELAGSDIVRPAPKYVREENI
jgi:hypothetical protein